MGFRKKHYSSLIVCFFFFMACSADDPDRLTEFELNHGIGPVTEQVELAELDLEKAREGRQIFESVCVACHQLDAVIVAPRLRNVLDRREPEFVLNYILNPVEMSKRHPVGQEMSGSFPGVKADLGISQEQAFLVLEYLRAANERAM